MKVLPIILLFIACQTSLAQKYSEVTDNDSVETNEERIEFIVDFMSAIQFETCADIGSGNLKLILEIANIFNEKVFVFEDIDSSLCNKDNMLSYIEKYNLNKIDTNKVSIHIGNTTSTLLPENNFDLVLINGVIHNINQLHHFFSDIKRILKPDGTVIISDAFYKTPPKPHQGCQNRFLTIREMEQIIVQQNLRVIKDWQRTGIQSTSNGPYLSRIIQCSFD
jgi:ubiquinone/menaquinone biosynthesis C-methylase UbiE